MMSGMSGMPMPAAVTVVTRPRRPRARPTGPNPVMSGARSALLGGDAGDVRYP